MTAPLLVVASDAAGATYQIVLKVRNPESRVGEGHYGGTSSACELICSSIAKALGLNVPDYAIVQVGAIFANGVGDNVVQRILAGNLGPNFGSVLITPQQQRWDPDCTSLSGQLRQAMDDVLSFDSVVVNGDRKRANPNLLWDGADKLHLIDHGLACIAHRWPDAQIASSPTLPDHEVQAHSGYTFLRGNNCPFDEVIGRWSGLGDQFWRDLRAAIPVEWELRPGDLDKIFDFLKARPMRFPDVNSELRRIVK